MKINQVAAQLYTLRDFLKTPADIKTTLKKVREIGYEAVQYSGLGPIEPAELKKLGDEAGLVGCATHEGADLIINDTQKVVDKLKALGIKYTAYPHPAGVDVTSKEQVDTLCRKLDAAGKLMAENGQVLGYHNHSAEFRRIEGTTTTMLEYVYANTNPKYLVAELDTYWVQHGGADNVDWCRKMKGRLPFIHFKDYGVNEKGPIYTEVGNGNLNWKAIAKAAEESGCEWFIVEQDTTPGDPFDSLAISFEYIKKNLVS